MASVLLVEPDIILGKTYRDSLVASDHKVTWCRTAQAAIGSTEKLLPDIVVLELQLPMHNGIEFLYEFRSYHDLRHIPVVVLSQVQPAQRAISSVLWDQLGIVAYHYKPFTRLADLARTIDSVMV
jgi:DNA-binding response OmpR family regulator